MVVPWGGCLGRPSSSERASRACRAFRGLLLTCVWASWAQGRGCATPLPGSSPRRKPWCWLGARRAGSVGWRGGSGVGPFRPSRGGLRVPRGLTKRRNRLVRLSFRPSGLTNHRNRWRGSLGGVASCLAKRRGRVRGPRAWVVRAWAVASHGGGVEGEDLRETGVSEPWNRSYQTAEWVGL